MNTRELWESLKRQEGECACPRLQPLFELGRRTQERFDHCRACVDMMVEARDDRSALCSHAKEIFLAAMRMKELYFVMLVKLIEEEHVTIVLHKQGSNGEIRSRTATWDEFENRNGKLFTLNCATCGQVVMASVMSSTACGQSN